MDTTPTGFSNFSREWKKLFSANYIFSCRLILVTSVHEKNFTDRTDHLGSKIRQREDAAGGRVAYFLTMKMTFSLNKFWFEVR